MKTLIILSILAFVSCDASNNKNPVRVQKPMQTIKDTVEFVGCSRASDGTIYDCYGIPQQCPVNQYKDIIGNLIYCDGEWRYLRRP